MLADWEAVQSAGEEMKIGVGQMEETFSQFSRIHFYGKRIMQVIKLFQVYGEELEGMTCRSTEYVMYLSTFIPDNRCFLGICNQSSSTT